jgi:hypothetical protein
MVSPTWPSSSCATRRTSSADSGLARTMSVNAATAASRSSNASTRLPVMSKVEYVISTGKYRQRLPLYVPADARRQEQSPAPARSRDRDRGKRIARPEQPRESKQSCREPAYVWMWAIAPSAPGLLGGRFRASTITCCVGTGHTEGALRPRSPGCQLARRSGHPVPAGTCAAPYVLSGR